MVCQGTWTGTPRIADPCDVLKIADHQGRSPEQTLQTLLEGEYERRLVGRQKARIKTAGFLHRSSIWSSWTETSCLRESSTCCQGWKHRTSYMSRNCRPLWKPRYGKDTCSDSLGHKGMHVEGMHVPFTSVPHLITQIKECKSAKTLHQLEGRFKKYDLCRL